MEKELKDYLDRISTDISEIRGTMATKEELAAAKDELGAKIDKVERKLTKKINDTLEYVKLVDEDVAAHRRNTEMHVPASRNA